MALAISRDNPQSQLEATQHWCQNYIHFHRQLSLGAKKRGAHTQGEDSNLTESSSEEHFLGGTQPRAHTHTNSESDRFYFCWAVVTDVTLTLCLPHSVCLAFLKLGGGGARRGACTLHLDKPALELVLKAQNLLYGTPQNATVHH